MKSEGQKMTLGFHDHHVIDSGKVRIIRIGKTTLSEAVCPDAAVRGAVAVVGPCCDLAETPPYGR
jgi:hypothetical protein